jgi:site-specific DNA recombinase
MFAEFVAEYSREVERIRDEQTGQHEAVARQLAAVNSRIGRIVNAIADGTSSPSLRAKLTELEAEKQHLETGVNANAPARCTLDLHPSLPDLYRRKVETLENALGKTETERALACNILQSLIEKIVVSPGKRRGETLVKVMGSIPAILELASRKSQEQNSNQSVALMVPRAGIEPATRGFSVRCSTN